MKVKCEYCDFKTMQHCLRPHMLQLHPERFKTSYSPSKTPSGDESDDEPSPNGRSKRRASKKALKRLSEKLKAADNDGDEEGDQEDVEDSDDEYNLDKLIDWNSMVLKKGKKFCCKKCNQLFPRKNTVLSHLKADHADDLEDDEDDVDDEEDQENWEDEVDDDLKDDEDDDDEAGDDDDDLDMDDDEEPSKEKRGKKSKKRKKKVIRTRERALTLDLKMVSVEKAFRKQNFNRYDFENFHSTMNDWTQMEAAQVEDYLPQGQKSAKLSTRKAGDDKSETTKTLYRFESYLDNNGHVTLFAGGPIWAADWCPLSSKMDDVLAISADRDFQDLDFITEPQAADCKGLIQLWQCGSLNKKTLPKFRVGIIHDFGKIWNLKWLPSGGECEAESKLPRLGLLAAACSDGTVRLMSIPQLDSLSKGEGPAFWKPSKVTTLKAGDNVNVKCLDLSWYRGSGHKVIAAAFSNGFVGLWNITTKSPLLRKSDTEFLPYLYFRAHLANEKICLDLCADSGVEKPRFLATGASDRVFNVWDLTNVHGGPSKRTRRHAVSDIKWLHNYPGHISVAHDDIYMISYTRTFGVDLAKNDLASVFCQNSKIWNQSYCPMKNLLFACTSAGEVSLMVGSHPRSRQVFKADKELTKRRINVYRTEVRTDGDVETAYLPDYDPENATVEFVDMQIDDFTQIPDEEKESVRNCEKMTAENPFRYPYAQVNRVSVNPNFKYASWLFSGSQAGFGRIHNVQGFKPSY